MEDTDGGLKDKSEAKSFHSHNIRMGAGGWHYQPYITTADTWEMYNWEEREPQRRAHMYGVFVERVYVCIYPANLYDVNTPQTNGVFIQCILLTCIQHIYCSNTDTYIYICI